MKPESKLSGILFLYCTLLWSTNWSLFREEVDAGKITATGYDLRTIGIAFGALAALFLTRRIWLRIRELLSQGIQIPRSVKLHGSWIPLIFLIPLGMTFSSSWHKDVDPGVVVKTTFVYGGSSSGVLIIISALVILLFQTLVKLEAYDTDQNTNLAGSRRTAAL